MTESEAELILTTMEIPWFVLEKGFPIANKLQSSRPTTFPRRLSFGETLKTLRPRWKMAHPGRNKVFPRRKNVCPA
jgi:hypothetical protein